MKCETCCKTLDAQVADAGPETINDVGSIVRRARSIQNKKKEYLLLFMLDARRNLIKKEIISIGILTASLAHPREIFAPMVTKGVCGFILVHNHPSGNPSPSDEDTRLTQRIKQASLIMGIEFLDHLIVAKTGCYSFKTAGSL